MKKKQPRQARPTYFVLLVVSTGNGNRQTVEHFLRAKTAGEALTTTFKKYNLSWDSPFKTVTVRQDNV